MGYLSVTVNSKRYHIVIKALVACLVLFSISVNADEFSRALSDAAINRTFHYVKYDGAYQSIDYPGGDVAANRGVCTDVIIRAYRTLGKDLQVLVHEDMRENFSSYPSKRIWGLTKTDKNIDHRRVPNLQTFFTRKGLSLSVSDKPENYKVGDIVTWVLPGDLPHIGIVVDRFSKDGTPLIVHNVGGGPELQDFLFSYPISGHYRFEVDVESDRENI